MVTEVRKTSRSHVRTYLNSVDYIAEQYQVGHISENEAWSLFELTYERLLEGLRGAFRDRIARGAFFRDPAPEHDGAASPVSPSDG